jgi:hypothetical protein
LLQHPVTFIKISKQDVEEAKENVQAELKTEVTKKKKKVKKVFGPLTPQERPIFLPGGRRSVT